MIALLSALLGYLGTAGTEFFKSSQDKRDKEHELAMLQAQRDMATTQADSDLQRTLAEADASHATAVQASYASDIAANVQVGNGWIVAYSATVRPTITYLFFLLYAAVKVAQFNLLLNPSFPWQQAAGFAQALVGIWTTTDMEIFEAVIGFWFGGKMSRAAK